MRPAWLASVQPAASSWTSAGTHSADERRDILEWRAGGNQHPRRRRHRECRRQLRAFAGAAADGTAGDVEIQVRDVSEIGSLTVTGQTFISTSASAASINPDLDSADSFAGNISIETFNDGSITLGNTLLFASANGQDNNAATAAASFSVAPGTASPATSPSERNSGSITISNLSANADGIGRQDARRRPVRRGRLAARSASTFDGSIHITGNTFLSALGVGGSFIGTGIPGSAQGGSGFGGFATIFVGGSGFNPDQAPSRSTAIRQSAPTARAATARPAASDRAAGRISGNKGTVLSARRRPSTSARAEPVAMPPSGLAASAATASAAMPSSTLSRFRRELSNSRPQPLPAATQSST